MQEAAAGAQGGAPTGAGDTPRGPDGAAAPGAGLLDPRALQVLTTEHWSLLSARSLAYNEAFTRAGMFLSFLSMSLVALALLAQAMAFSYDFLLVATLYWRSTCSSACSRSGASLPRGRRTCAGCTA